MIELKAEREFGQGVLLGDVRAAFGFFEQPLEAQVEQMGWSHACPVIDEVVAKHGLEWTLKRYSECNFVHGVILEAARKFNPVLYEQLTTSIPRIATERPGRSFKHQNIPDNFYEEMSPLSTPWGYALSRVVIEVMGRGENNIDRTEKRILKSLRLIDRAVKKAKTPEELLVYIAEEAVKMDADPNEVLGHMLARGILEEEGCKQIFDDIKFRMDRHAPILRQKYNAMSPDERYDAGVINF